MIYRNGMAKIPLGRKTILLDGIPVGEYESTGDTTQDMLIARTIMKDKGLLKKEPPLDIAMRQQALYFAKTAAHLFNTQLMQSPRRPFAFVPFVVNSTFAIELYLKTLAQMYGKAPKKIHELLKLYDDLPQAAQDAIASKILECAARRQLHEEPDVRTYLSELNKTFDRWRYAYEYESAGEVRLEPTIFLQEVLLEACKIQPDNNGLPISRVRSTTSNPQE